MPPPITLTAKDNCDGDLSVNPIEQLTPGACENDFTTVNIKGGRVKEEFKDIGESCTCDFDPSSNGLVVNQTDSLPILNDQVIFDVAKLRVYPNPASIEMTIEFSIPETTRAVIELYDMHGRRVTRIFEQNVDAGLTYVTKIKRQQLQLPQGTYFYRLRAGRHNLQGKVLFFD